jgi:PRTRC genetic system protein C
MALEVTGLNRKFIFKKGNQNLELEDPNPKLTPEEVMRWHVNTHPELNNATIAGPTVEGDKALYEFKTTLGSKG